MHVSKLICIFVSSIKISWLICRVTSFIQYGESDTKGQDPKQLAQLIMSKQTGFSFASSKKSLIETIDEIKKSKMSRNEKIVALKACRETEGTHQDGRILTTQVSGAAGQERVA